MKAHSGRFTNNPAEHGVPNSIGTILLFDARSCALICIMDGSLITGLRTGASGAVSVKALARKNARTIASISTGNQARMQIRAVKRMKIEKIHAWSRTPESLSRYKTDIQREFGIPVIVASSKKEAVEQADILITTRGKGELVEADLVKPGTQIVTIGTDQRGKQELDPELFRNAKIIVDSISQCTEKGETWHPLNKRKPGRESDDASTIFDFTGVAIQDNTTASKIYQNATSALSFSFLSNDHAQLPHLSSHPQSSADSARSFRCSLQKRK